PAAAARFHDRSGQSWLPTRRGATRTDQEKPRNTHRIWQILPGGSVGDHPRTLVELAQSSIGRGFKGARRCSNLPLRCNEHPREECGLSRSPRALLHGTASAVIALAAFAPNQADAKVTKIVIEKKTSPAFDGASSGAAGQYEILVGKAYGELDPKDPHNAIITDIGNAPTTARGMAEYMAPFQLANPIDMSKSSHFMWHDVPNRGGRLTLGAQERGFGDVGLSSGWQGDNSGATAPKENNDYV